MHYSVVQSPCRINAQLANPNYTAQFLRSTNVGGS